MIGEDLACLHLDKNGYHSLVRNFKCKMGEIDLVGRISEYLVFVEVKTRRMSSTGVDPLLSITASKRRKLRKLGEFYLVTHRLEHLQPRFDVIGIDYNSEEDFSLNHIENAF